MAGRPYLIVYRPQQSFQKQQENYVSKQTIDQNHLEHFSADFGAKQLFHAILCEIGLCARLKGNLWTWLRSGNQALFLQQSVKDHFFTDQARPWSKTLYLLYYRLSTLKVMSPMLFL